MGALQFILLSQFSNLLGNLNANLDTLLGVLIDIFARIANLIVDLAAAILPPAGV